MDRGLFRLHLHLVSGTLELTNELFEYNSKAWNAQVRKGNQWTIPVDSETVEKARQGEWQIVLTPVKPVPRDWFPRDLKGCKMLLLAGGGGQQGPVLAAVGADVTVYDLSSGQLGRDREVAERDGLKLTCVQGNMQDLSVFADDQFDLIVHPCSNSFVPDVNPVWKEAFRVLKPGGHLMAGMVNSMLFLFDEADMDRGVFEAKYSLPYSDTESLDAESRQRYIDQNEPLCFGHTLNDQIGGQLRAGFHMVDFYEDGWPDLPFSKFADSMFATLSRKPRV